MSSRNLILSSPQFTQITPQSIANDLTEDQCKFCFQTQKQSNQKLISPCGCCGSMKYVHKDCLQKWITAEADKKDDHSPYKKKPNGYRYQCKLCEKDIILQEEFCLIFQILTMFKWIYFLYYIKKVKYYFCISVIGSLALSYYFSRFLFGRIFGFVIKMKDYSIISLIILSLSILIYDQTFIEVKWNSSYLELSIPYLINK